MYDQAVSSFLLIKLIAQGAICLDTLSTAWSPVLTIKSALLSLQSLLSTPEPKDPQDAEVATMLLRRPQEFARVAQEWAVMYAGAPRRHAGEGSGGVTDETLRLQEIKSKEEQEQEDLSKYVHVCRTNLILANLSVQVRRLQQRLDRPIL